MKPRNASKIAVGIPLLFPIVVLLLYFLAVAARLQVDYLDSYEVLVNSRRLLGEAVPYFPLRTIGSTALQAPLRLLEETLQIPGMQYRASFFFSVLCFAGVLILYYRLAGRVLSGNWALFSVLLFASTPILIHYIPMSKVDLPALFFLMAGMLLLSEPVESRARNFLCGLALCAAVATRYNFAPFLALFVPGYGIFLWTRHPRLFPSFARRIGAAAILAGLFAVIASLIRPSAIPSLFSSIYSLVDYNWKLSSWDAGAKYHFLFSMVPIPLIPFAVLGAWKTREPFRMLLVLWATLFFVCHTYFLPGKEARFLFPVLVPLGLLVVQGLRTATTRFSPRLLKGVAAVAIVAAVLRGAMECALFLDPFYYTPFDRSVARTVQSLAPRDVVWVGHSVGRHPQYFRYPYDELAYIYHFHPLSLFFHLDRPVTQLFDGDLIERADPRAGYWLKNIGKVTESGTVFVVNPNPESTFAWRVTPEKKPIFVQRSRFVPFHKRSDLPDGDYETYVTRNGKRHAVGIFSLRKGSLIDWKEKSPPEWLLYYDEVVVFWTT